MKSKIIRRTTFCLIIVSIFFPSANILAEVEPVQGIEPSGTLPILYINTENSTKIDQKVTYIDAEWWLESKGFEGYEDIGSAEKPQNMGIRGRGNTSWIHDGQKPYKMKLDKKTSILGMPKNKHWALLARLKNWHLYNEVLAFELGRKLGMPFAPQAKPVEVVLNNTYIGLYFLTETIRVDDNRVEIYEQPEGNEDPETIDGGWLVEMDNNVEEFQVSIPHPKGYNLLITHHTPEVTSQIQDEWLTNQFSQIIESINSDNLLENRWEELVDVSSLAKHWIVEESFQNFDGYLGSCYIHKDIDGKWNFGPLWDFSACWVYKSDMLAERENQHLIGEFFKFPSFRKEAKKIWNEYNETIGNDWVEPFLKNLKEQIDAAVRQSVQVWPDTPLDAEEGYNWALSAFKHNANFNNNFFKERCNTYDITISLINLSSYQDSVLDLSTLFDISLNGLARNEGTFFEGENVEIEIVKKSENIRVNGLYLNGTKYGFNEKKTINLNDLKQDIVIGLGIEFLKDPDKDSGSSDSSRDWLKIYYISEGTNRVSANLISDIDSVEYRVDKIEGFDSITKNVYVFTKNSNVFSVRVDSIQSMVLGGNIPTLSIDTDPYEDEITSKEDYPETNLVFKGHQKNFVVFSKPDGIPLEALPILDGTVIRFEEDSVFLKKDNWETKIDKSELREFEYVKDFRSDMTVRVVTNDSLQYPLEGMTVTLHNEYNDDIFGIVNLTGENGETVFRNIPPGFYSIYIADPNNNFESDALSGVHHGLPSTNELLAKEKVISPYLLHYNITASEKGFYDLWLEWESNANLTDYSYYIYLNYELIGETSDQWYQISGLTPGEYEISVLAVSSYGNVSDAPRKITVVVEEYNSEVELLPDDEVEKDSPYFDLLGRVVKNPLPGIYIHNGKKVLVK